MERICAFFFKMLLCCSVLFLRSVEALKVTSDICDTAKTLSINETMYLNYFGDTLSDNDSKGPKECALKISSPEGNTAICISKLARGKQSSLKDLVKCGIVFRYHVGTRASKAYSCLAFESNPLCTTRKTAYAIFVYDRSEVANVKDVRLQLKVYVRKPVTARDKLLEFVTSKKSSSLPPVRTIETNQSSGNTLSSRLTLHTIACVIVVVLTRFTCLLENLFYFL